MPRWTHLLLALACLLSLPARADDTAIAAQLTALGGQLTPPTGLVTKAAFADASKLGEPEYRLIGQLHGLKSLNLGACPTLTDATLSLLTGLTSLEELTTNGMQVSDAGLAQLSTFTNLHTLTLFHPCGSIKGFTGAGFASLQSLAKLESLSIGGSPFGDPGMAAIAQLPHLRALRLWHTYVTKEGLKPLAKLQQLTSLRLGQRLPHRDAASNAPKPRRLHPRPPHHP